ncbi:unnamed protein product [Rhizoctonia solani]|uniref:Fungal-type protein kinase domain-containing protein n=1 Tax=Rhizoctonia solani TaxID=456999 RepID=A0A8H2WBV5_9AGAM|nr:unnamed protein product [Rhizoctonia solani]
MSRDPPVHRSSQQDYERMPEPELYIDKIIEPQFRNSIFVCENFIGEFLSLAPQLDDVVGLCLGYDQYLRIHRKWRYPTTIDSGQDYHQPVLHILNTIKSATDAIRSAPGFNSHNPNDSSSAAKKPPVLRYEDCDPLSDPRLQPPGSPHGDVEYFEDWSSRDLASDLSDEIMHNLQPNLILFNSKRRHWSNIRIIVEVMESEAYVAAGFKQLARYAYATFRHQYSRRHLYSILILGDKAIFLRFDHAGIISSTTQSVTDNADFVTALANLLVLDDVDQGFDPAFKFEDDGNYIDLLECMLGENARLTPEDGSNVATKSRRFRILEQCYTRNRLVGPGTVVFRIREHFTHGWKVDADQEAGTRADVGEESDRSPEEYTLKLTWRLDNNQLEGEAIEQAEGTFGLAQHVSHGDIVMPGRCKCLLTPGVLYSQALCKICVDRTPTVRGLLVPNILKDLSIDTTLEGDSRLVPECPDQILLQRAPPRTSRIYSYILFSSFGKPMHQAESPEIYLAAMMDALLGYWGLYNMGIVHREISRHNLLLATKEQKFTLAWWKRDRQINEPTMGESEERRRYYLDWRMSHTLSPTGMLIDLASHARLEPEAPPPSSSQLGAQGSLPPTSFKEGTHKTTKRRGKSAKSRAAMPVGRRNNRNSNNSVAHAGPQSPLDLVVGFNGIVYSVRVAKMILIPQQLYRHHFYDDIESFFWVMLWEAIAHVDPGKQLNKHARNLLENFQMSDTRYLHIKWKEDTLQDCMNSGGRTTLARLSACDNTWASHGNFRIMVVSLLGFIATLRKEKVVRPAAVVFNEILQAFKAFGIGERSP